MRRGHPVDLPQTATSPLRHDPAYAPSMSKLARRLPLPLYSGVNVLPGQTITLVARSQLEEFLPDRILIKNALRWRVMRIRIQGRPQLGGERPVSLFDPYVATSPRKMDHIPQGGELEVRVKYVGPCEGGEPFECCVLGTTEGWRAAPPIGKSGREILTVEASALVEHSDGGIKLLLPPRTEEFWPERLAIKDPTDWIVNDIFVNGKSCLVQSGDLPGAMFSEGETNPPLRIGPLSPKDELAVAACYVGSSRSDARLTCSLSGPKHADDVAPDTMRLLPMSSGVNILPNTSAAITSRLSSHVLPGQGFRPRRIVIDGAEDWSIGDVKVGVVSQFAQNGDIPGVAFSADAIGTLVALDPVPVWIDFTIIVTYVGSRDTGAAFVCGVAGDVVDLATKTWASSIHDEPRKPRAEIGRGNRN